MLYELYRDNIETGDLLAWSNRKIRRWDDIFKQGIRLFTRSEFHHVGIAWVISGRLFVIEAVPPLVRIYPLSKETPFYHIKMDVPVNDKAEAFLLGTVGEPYSVWSAIRSYFSKPNEDHQWQCAEYAREFYQSVGIHLGEAFTPSDIVEAALTHSPHGMRLIQQ